MTEESEDLKDQAAHLRAYPVSANQRPARADRFRDWFYLGLLAFVVVVGLPIVGVPSLRHRLAGRVQELRTAMSTDSSRPAPLTARVGENQDPLPKEYELPVLPRQPLLATPAEHLYRMESGRKAEPVQTSEPRTTAPSDSDPSGSQAASADAEPVYRQGKLEQEAYDVLLKSSDLVAGMVQGKDPSLRFKSWSAAKTEDDAFLVRLVFTKDNAEVPYIWQVKVVSKQITPLSYSARSLTK